MLGESRKSADKANSLHSLAAEPYPRPGRPTLSHHSLPHKGHSTEDFPETNARVVGGAEARRNSWPSQVGVAPTQAFTQTRDAMYHPPKMYFTCICVFTNRQLTCCLILDFNHVWNQTEVMGL